MQKMDGRELTAEKGVHGSESGSWVTGSKMRQTQAGPGGSGQREGPEGSDRRERSIPHQKHPC